LETITDILSLIPQRPPFVMIDALVGFAETTTKTTFIVQENNILVENGELQESGLVENIAQTAAARVGWIAQTTNKPVPVGYIGAVQHLEINTLPQIGDKLETEITIKNQIFDVTVISGKISRNQEILAQCEMKIFIVRNQ
jgi:predicted hotdog family 3-hydroxylacyl-ACP dehydratase